MSKHTSVFLLRLPGAGMAPEVHFNPVNVLSGAVMKFERALGAPRPLASVELHLGVTLDVQGQPFSIAHDERLWVLQFVFERRPLRVTESVTVYGRETGSGSLTHPIATKEEQRGLFACSAVLGEELVRPRVHRFLCGAPASDGLYFLERMAATFRHRIREHFLFDVKAGELLLEREYYPREDWASSV